VSSNKVFDLWGDVFGDNVFAAAEEQWQSVNFGRRIAISSIWL
jgi:hypothetical protein